MGLEDLTPRIALLGFLGWAITILFIKGGVSLFGNDYRRGALFLVLGAGLGIIFFRKRKIALTIIALTFVLVNAGLTAAFHPTLLGILLTVGSAAGLYLLAVWQAKNTHASHGKIGRRSLTTTRDRE